MTHPGTALPPDGAWWTDAAWIAAVTEGLPAFLRGQRWYPGRARQLADVSVRDIVPLDRTRGHALLVVVVSFTDGSAARLAVPAALLVADTPAPDVVAAHVIATRPGSVPVLVHGELCTGAGATLLQGLLHSRRWISTTGALHGEPTAFGLSVRNEPGLTAARPVGGEQSNSSIVFGERLILKLFRQLHQGRHPEHEVLLHLTARAAFDGVPPLAGALVLEDPSSGPATLATAQAFVPGAEPLRARLVPALTAVLPSATPSSTAPGSGATGETFDAVADAHVAIATHLGHRTADLHLALATPLGDEAFEPEPVSRSDLARLAARLAASVSDSLDRLRVALADLSPADRRLGARVLAHRAEFDTVVRRVEGIVPDFARIRIHGDLQLDQVLVIPDGRLLFIDFEGEPLRPVDERRARWPALRDVAGMWRSFDYAAWTAAGAGAGEGCAGRGTGGAAARAAAAWRDRVARAFLAAYRSRLGATALVPARDADFDALLQAFILDRACYELRYELAYRPAWAHIPLRGLAGLALGDGNEAS